MGGSLLLVPLSLHYLGETRYGIWLTISSVVTWFSVLNIGLGNGMRNKLAKSLSSEDYELAKEYVSTTYAAISAIMVVFLVIFLIANNFINWVSILNAPSQFKSELSLLAIIVFSSFAIRMVMQLVTTIAIATQEPAVSNVINLINKLLILLGIFILYKIKLTSLVLFGLLYMAIPLVILLGASFYFFTGIYSNLRPSYRSIKPELIKDLLNLGTQFFVLEVGAIILMTTDNVIITQLFRPSEVTKYQIVNKYFSFVLTFFIVMISPLWSAVTEAFHEKDFNWIKRTINNYLKVIAGLSIVVILMFVLSNRVYNLWLGYNIHIPILLSGLFAVYILLRIISSLFTNFVNGTGYLRISLATSLFAIILNVPLSILFSKYVFNSSAGVIFATIISMLLSVVFKSIQYYKIVNDKAEGIWAK